MRAALQAPAIPAFTSARKRQFEKRLQNADSVEEIEGLFQEYFDDIDPRLIQVLIEKGIESGRGAAAKLREFYWEVKLFDVQTHLKTSGFVPEDEYEEAARSNRELLAAPEVAHLGVKQRSSLTRTTVDSFRTVGDLIRDKGLDPNMASLIDYGAGEGKPVFIGMSKGRKGFLPFTFKRAVGIDFHKPAVETANRNLQIAQRTLGIDPSHVKFVFDDAANFHDFNGLNVGNMYNPFGLPIVKRVEKNMRDYGGKAFMIYVKPEHPEPFDKHGWRREREFMDSDPDRCVIIFSRGLD